MKVAHYQQPLGKRRFQYASVNNPQLHLCPCCKTRVDAQFCIFQCPSNPAKTTSLTKFSNCIRGNNIHPVHSMFVAGIWSWFADSTMEFLPDLTSFTSHLQLLIQQEFTEKNSMVGTSMVAMEVKSVVSLLTEMDNGSPVLPSILNKDNTGTIFIAKNTAIGQRTKHVDIRYHFVNNMILAKELLVEHIRSGENPSNAMTKNLCLALFGKHASIILDGLLGNLYDPQKTEDVKSYCATVLLLICQVTLYHVDSVWTTMEQKLPVPWIVDQRLTASPKEESQRIIDWDWLEVSRNYGIESLTIWV